jgi:hypothetical protein
MSEYNDSRSSPFQQLLEAARSRKGGSGDTTVITGHLAQMRLFMMRQGVEFYPRQDSYGFRKSFLERIIEENEIDARLEGIGDDFVLDGLGLWFFRPVKDTYRIMWFTRNNYRSYYDADEQIDEIDLIYSYKERSQANKLNVSTTGGFTTKWVRLVVRKDEIIEEISNERPSFEDPIGSRFSPSRVSAAASSSVIGKSTRTTRNSLGFIPAVEAFNNMRSSGMDATGDFDGLEGHIMVHDSLVRNIRENIRFYGNPTLVSSRAKHEMMESGDEQSRRPTIASRAGFESTAPRSNWSNSGGGRFDLTGAPSLGSNMRVPRLIANLEATDRVQYITPNAVSGDQNMYARQYREEIRTALGGVDELGISSGATAYEIKSLFGRAATTALRKCRGLLTYGLCKLLGLMIHHEEKIFRDSFSAALGIAPPSAPIFEQFEADGATAEYEEAERIYREEYAAWEQEIEANLSEALENQDLPVGVVGLIPDGDRRVEWRWRGPVFEESPEDVLNASIVVRNLQELGVDSVEALKHLFPSKTDEERSAMLSGYPFRMAQATQQSIGTFLSLIGDMQQIPHPQQPDLPLLADPRLDLVPFVYRAFDFLKRELTYAGQFNDAAGASGPSELDAIGRARAGAGLPAELPGSSGPFFLPDSTRSSTANGGSVAGGLSAPERRAERDAPIPAPGTVLATSATGGSLPGLLPFAYNQLPSGVQYGDPDFAAPSNAGLFAELSERAAERASAVRPDPDPARGRGRVPKRRKQRKS